MKRNETWPRAIGGVIMVGAAFVVTMVLVSDAEERRLYRERRSPYRVAPESAKRDDYAPPPSRDAALAATLSSWYSCHQALQSTVAHVCRNDVDGAALTGPCMKALAQQQPFERNKSAYTQAAASGHAASSADRYLRECRAALDIVRALPGAQS